MALFLWAVTVPVWATSWTLVDCLNEALQKNPQILQAQQENIRAGGAVIVAKAALYPQVNSTGTVYYSDTDVFRQQQSTNPGFNASWYVNLSVSQTFYNGGVTRNQIANAKLMQDVAMNQLQESVNQVIFDTRKAFYDVLLSESDVDLRKQTIELLKKEVDRQKSLFEAGRATKFNIIRTEVRLANELPGLEQANVANETAIYDLLNSMGYSAPPSGKPLDVQISGSLEITPYEHDVDQLVTEARHNSPELAGNEKSIEIERRNIAIAKASNIPQLSFYAGTQEQQNTGEGPGFFENSNQSTIGLAGVWNVFDGLAGKGNALQAEARMKQNIIQRDTVNRRIEYDVRKAILNLKEAENSYQTQHANVKKALESIDLARSAVEAGFGTQFDILQATVDLSNAQNIELKARYQYSLATADLDRVLYRRIKGTTGVISDLNASASSSPDATHP